MNKIATFIIFSFFLISCISDPSPNVRPNSSDRIYLSFAFHSDPSHSVSEKNTYAIRTVREIAAEWNDPIENKPYNSDLRDELQHRTLKYNLSQELSARNLRIVDNLSDKIENQFMFYFELQNVKNTIGGTKVAILITLFKYSGLNSLSEKSIVWTGRLILRDRDYNKHLQFICKFILNMYQNGRNASEDEIFIDL